MRTLLFLLLLLLAAPIANAQDKLHLSAATEFNFGAQGLGMNDAGVGAQLAASYLLKGRLHIRGAAGAHGFFGDKLLVTDAGGNALERNPTLWLFTAGPELFFSPQLSAAAGLGLARYQWMEDRISTGAARLSLQSYPGQNRRLFFSLSYTVLMNREPLVQFYGVGLGLRFFNR